MRCGADRRSRKYQNLPAVIANYWTLDYHRMVHVPAVNVLHREGIPAGFLDLCYWSANVLMLSRL
jgi:hypothetical protein